MEQFKGVFNCFTLQRLHNLELVDYAVEHTVHEFSANAHTVPDSIIKSVPI